MIQRQSDASKTTLVEQFRGFNRVFWIANAMEMFERLAYYGLRTVLPVYMVLSLAEGGPQFDHVQKGIIFSIWAAFQSIIPVFTGGYADKYGYKLTIGIAIAIKVVGYLIMAYAIEIAAMVSGGASVGVAGHESVLWTFGVGAVALAIGTAVFKPGLQGIVALQLNDSNSSTGWSVFYQLVNFGAWIGPFLAGVLRLISWRWVFIACALIVCINYLILLTFPEPERAANGSEKASTDSPGIGSSLKILWHSFIGICEPRLMSFLVLFSGFWLMFFQLFDLLPNFLEDWVDSTMIQQAVVVPIMDAFGSSPPEEWGGHVPQEHLVNLNAGMIMFLAFLVGFITGKIRSMIAMIVGIAVSAAAIWSFSTTMNGWTIVGGIALFSIGEMIASPTKLRYIANIAPEGRKGLYLGYINATVGIGWSLGSIIAGDLYQAKGDKVVLASQHLVEKHGMDADQVAAMPKDDVVPLLMEKTQLSELGVREILWNAYDPGQVWESFAMIGIVSMFGLILFDLITRFAGKEREPYLLLVVTGVISGATYGLWWAALFCGFMVLYMGVERKAPWALDQPSES